MKLIVGLGNVGEQYENTRHNAGFLFLDFCAEQEASKQQAGEWQFLQPQSMMNRSGGPVKQAVEKHGVDLSDLLVVHDDVDLPFGEYRIQFGRGDAGHNGVKSIIGALGSRDFWRLRIGIGRPASAELRRGTPSKATEDYVLEPFTTEEQKALPEIFAAALHDLFESEFI